MEQKTSGMNSPRGHGSRCPAEIKEEQESDTFLSARRAYKYSQAAPVVSGNGLAGERRMFGFGGRRMRHFGLIRLAYRKPKTRRIPQRIQKVMVTWAV